MALRISSAASGPSWGGDAGFRGLNCAHKGQIGSGRYHLILAGGLVQFPLASDGQIVQLPFTSLKPEVVNVRLWPLFVKLGCTAI